MATSQILASYSPEDVAVLISNDMFSHTNSGTIEDIFLTISRVEPHAVLYTGADASNARVVRRIKNCDVSIILMQTSESNDVLSQLLIRDENSRDGRDTF